MSYFVVSFQFFIFVAMLDVWLIRYNKPVLMRGGNAKTMKDEFKLYGLPDWFRNLMRTLKLLCGFLMVALVFGIHMQLFSQDQS
jgi:hypothetical protein